MPQLDNFCPVFIAMPDPAAPTRVEADELGAADASAGVGVHRQPKRGLAMTWMPGDAHGAVNGDAHLAANALRWA